MDIQEAIRHCEEKAEDLQKKADDMIPVVGEPLPTKEELKERYDCEECANEHRQLAEWLKELKQYKGKETEKNRLIEESNRKRQAIRERNIEIYELRKSGVQYKDIAKTFGISTTRAGQIVRKEEWIRTHRR